MSDLIDRQALLEKKIRIPIARIVTEDKIIYRDVVFVKDIEALPSAEPQIIRCKDCTWWTNQSTTLQGKCRLHNLNPMPEWYCASGAVVE